MLGLMSEPQSLPFGGEILPFDGSAFLVPDFLSSGIADEMFTKLLTTTAWENTSLIMFGKKVAEPRQSTWHACPELTYTYSGSQHIPQPWTDTLISLRTLCEIHIGTTFNGLLINHYRDGHDYVGWHADNELCNGPEPTIASISLGAERRFDFRHRDTNKIVSTNLPHGSLLVMSGLSQQRWVHRLPKQLRIHTPRINLTFRLVQCELSVTPQDG